jgi:hypothetical protein
MTVPTREQITDFVNRYFTGLPRCYGPLGFRPAGYGGLNQGRRAAKDIAQELLGCAEFRALQLGTWLGTTNGEIITQAVEAVMPPFYAEDVALIVEALNLAAAMQQREGRQKALVGAAVTFAAIGIGYAASRRNGA